MKYDKVITFLISLYCLLLPFEEILAFSFGSLNKIVGILIILYVIIQYRNNLYLKNSSIRLCIWIIYLVISIIWSASISWWKYFFQLYFVQSVFFCTILFIPKGKVNIKLIKHSIILAGFIAASILIFLPNTSVLTDEGRRTIVLFGNTFDPNLLAAILIISIYVSLSVLYGIKLFSQRILIFIVVGIIATGLLLTGSRGALIAFVVSFIMYLFFKTKDRNQRRKSILIFIASIGVLFILLSVLPENLISSRYSINNILGLNEYTAGAHNRYTIWQHSLELFISKPILGYGCGNFFPALGTVYREAASHNMYILLLVEGGLVGFLLFFSFMFRIFKELMIEKNIDHIIILIAMLILALSLDSITYKYFWFVLIYFQIDYDEKCISDDNDK